MNLELHLKLVWNDSKMILDEVLDALNLGDCLQMPPTITKYWILLSSESYSNNWYQKLKPVLKSWNAWPSYACCEEIV